MLFYYEGVFLSAGPGLLYHASCCLIIGIDTWSTQMLNCLLQIIKRHHGMQFNIGVHFLEKRLGNSRNHIHAIDIENEGTNSITICFKEITRFRFDLIDILLEILNELWILDHFVACFSRNFSTNYESH
jgi:hypothetical protein